MAEKMGKKPVPGGQYFVNGEWVDADGNPLDPETRAAKLQAQMAFIQSQMDAINAPVSEPAPVYVPDIEANAPEDDGTPESHEKRKAWAIKSGLPLPVNVSPQRLKKIIAGMPK